MVSFFETSHTQTPRGSLNLPSPTEEQFADIGSPRLIPIVARYSGCITFCDSFLLFITVDYYSFLDTI